MKKMIGKALGYVAAGALVVSAGFAAFSWVMGAYSVKLQK